MGRGKGETRRDRKSVCFVSDCAAMIDDAVNGILLETLWRVNRQQAWMNNNSVTALLIRITRRRCFFCHDH